MFGYTCCNDVTAAEVLTAINNSNFLSAPGKTENEYVVYTITVRSTPMVW